MNAGQSINQTSGEVEYYTPSHIIEAARFTMGGIDLDPASSQIANRNVKASRFFTQSNNGLVQKWTGRVWMNHPFGKVQNPLWISKLMQEYTDGNCTQFCCITYACTSERWFAPLMGFAQCFLAPRTNYILPDGSTKKGVTKGSVVTYGGVNVAQFAKQFQNKGAIKVPYRL